MGSHQATHHTSHVRAREDFLARVIKNLGKETVTTLKFLRSCMGLFFAITLGIILFVKEFDFIKIVIALIFPLLFIYGIGNYLTLLPANLIIGMVVLAAISLAQSEKGTSLTDWFSEIFTIMFSAYKEPSSLTLTQKLMGFVSFSSVVSFFIIFFI